MDDEKKSGWVSRAFERCVGRHVDRDRAARHWGKALIASKVAWGLKAAVITVGLTDLFVAYAANTDPALGLVENAVKNKHLAFRIAPYYAVWFALHVARWGLLGYSGVGMAQAYKLRKQKALGASPTNP